jgi:S-adenosylmethionine decarboxylase
MDTTSVHLICEFGGCNADILNDLAQIKEAMHAATAAANCTVLSENYHQFTPVGVSALFFLAESHFSLHTWPENGYAAVDIYTCGHRSKPHSAVEILGEVFEAQSIQVVDMKRGIPVSDGVFTCKIRPARKFTYTKV